MTPLLIRPASIKDIPSIVKVRLGAFTEAEVSGFTSPEYNPFLSTEGLVKKWGKENRLIDGFEVFVAELRGKIVGFIVYNMESCNDNIDNIVVTKEEQGKGIGRTLVEYVEKLAKSRGYNVIRTDTTEDINGVPWKGYGFWIKMGYRDTGERIPTKYSFKVIPLVKNLT